MVRIRLARHGKLNDPFYRIVVIEKSRKVTGKALAICGHWHPRTKDLKIDKKEIQAWIEKGAQPSKTVLELMESK
jgi:small subunit ribosomal protein S16